MAPLVGIDINHVEQNSMRSEFGLEQIRRHCRPEYDYVVEAVFLEQAPNVSLQTGACKSGLCDGFARSQRACASH